MSGLGWRGGGLTLWDVGVRKAAAQGTDPVRQQRGSMAAIPGELQGHQIRLLVVAELAFPIRQYRFRRGRCFPKATALGREKLASYGHPTSDRRVLVLG